MVIWTVIGKTNINNYCTEKSLHRNFKNTHLSCRHIGETLFKPRSFLLNSFLNHLVTKSAQENLFPLNEVLNCVGSK